MADMNYKKDGAYFPEDLVMFKSLQKLSTRELLIKAKEQNIDIAEDTPRIEIIKALSNYRGD